MWVHSNTKYNSGYTYIQNSGALDMYGDVYHTDYRYTGVEMFFCPGTDQLVHDADGNIIRGDAEMTIPVKFVSGNEPHPQTTYIEGRGKRWRCIAVSDYSMFPWLSVYNLVLKVDELERNSTT